MIVCNLGNNTPQPLKSVINVWLGIMPCCIIAQCLPYLYHLSWPHNPARETCARLGCLCSVWWCMVILVVEVEILCDVLMLLALPIPVVMPVDAS